MWRFSAACMTASAHGGWWANFFEYQIMKEMIHSYRAGQGGILGRTAHRCTGLGGAAG